MTTTAKLVGKIYDHSNNWHQLKDGRTVSFHTAFLDKERERAVTFYANNETWPSDVAQSLGLAYIFLRNATLEETAQFLLDTGLELKG